MDIHNQLGLTVQRIRRTCGWAREGLAVQSRLDRTHIGGIERGKRNPTVIVLNELADE